MKPSTRRKKRRIEKKLEQITEQLQKEEPYTLLAYVTGPVYKIDVSAKSYDEACSKAMKFIEKELVKYNGEVKIDKIELYRSELVF
jgi:translation initiation factor 2 alpha subunit (eIF-2alpha)